MSDAEKREHICPLEEYVRRSTGEIDVRNLTGYLSRAEQSRWRDRVMSAGTDVVSQEHKLSY